jgi:hypothetical protein
LTTVVVQNPTLNNAPQLVSQGQTTAPTISQPNSEAKTTAVLEQTKTSNIYVAESTSATNLFPTYTQFAGSGLQNKPKTLFDGLGMLGFLVLFF